MAWKLPAKPQASAIVVSLALLVSTVAAVVYTHRLQTLMSATVADNVKSLQAAEELEFALRDIRNALLQYALQGDLALLTPLNDLDKEVRQAHLEAFKTAVVQEERDWLDELRGGYEGLSVEIEHLQDVEDVDSRKAEARRLSDTLSHSLMPLARNFLEFNEETIEESAAAHGQTAQRLKFILVLAGFFVPITGVIVGFLASRSISRQLDASRQELLRSEQLAAVGRLAAGMAHELRNPLTSIMMMVQTSTPEEPADFDVITDEVRRMERTIQSCLDFAKPPVLDRGAVDLRDTVQAARRLVEARVRRQQLELVVEQPSGPLVVFGDKHQLHQVLVNLLLNAIESVGVRRRIGIISESDGDDAVVRVWDEGPGISQELLAQVFDPFVSTKPAGTGLGLSITKTIITSHGGRIDARNRAEGGAEFIIRLQRFRSESDGVPSGPHVVGDRRRAQHSTRVPEGVSA